MTYYGQWDTDKVIETYFPDQNTGVCVEVGAYDGIKGSNTKHFEDKGWDALCIEPNPNVWERLIKNRPKSICCSDACSDSEGTAMLEVFDFSSGIQSSLTSLNTDERLIEQYVDAIENRTKVKVSTNKLSVLLRYYYLMNIDFISIDTEGTELDVLKGMDFANRPKLLVIENNYDDPEITEYLDEFGYRHDQRYKVNDFYVDTLRER
jgi:FkbM family methyltransferase